MPRRTPGRNSTHRSPRDSQRSQELSDLRRENHQLKRTLSKLRREGERLELLAPDDPEPAQAPRVSHANRRCVHCESTDLASFTTPSGRVVYGCRACSKPQPLS